MMRFAYTQLLKGCLEFLDISYCIVKSEVRRLRAVNWIEATILK